MFKLLVLAALAVPCAPLTQHSVAARSPSRRRAGNLSLVFCDVKRALADDRVTLASLDELLPALVSSMGCNGLRVPLLPTAASPAEFPATLNKTLAFARAAGLAIYASPMEGSWSAVGGTPDRYAAWVAALAAGVRPTHLSCFNEVGGACPASGTCMEGIVVAVRRALAAAASGAGALPLFVGPDAEHVAASLADIRSRPHALDVFDIVSSHNAGADPSNDAATWAALKEAAGGRQVWASENPSCFTIAACLKYGSMQVAIDAGAHGLVSWDTLGDDVTVNGTLTDKGADIANHTG
jgi:hypothetical protein